MHSYILHGVLSLLDAKPFLPVYCKAGPDCYNSNTMSEEISMTTESMKNKICDPLCKNESHERALNKLQFGV